MNKLKEFLYLEDKKVSNKILMIYILLAYTFSIAVRLILYYQIHNSSDFFYNSHIIPLWTPDSGLYGYYAEQLLNGVKYPFISEYAPAYLIYGVVKLTGIDLNSAIFFLPAFLSSLVVIPIILLSNHYKLARVGLYGSIIGSLMTSYYYRTHLGYYDTDILNAFFPLLAIYFLIRFIDTIKTQYIFYSLFTLTLFAFWYHSSAPIILSILVIFLIYNIIYNRKRYFKYIGLLTAIVVSILLLTDNSYYSRVTDYLNKGSSIEINSKFNNKVKFSSDLTNVIEARDIDISEVAYRVSGAMVFFIIAFLGYIALIIRYRSMLLTLPLVIISFFSMVAGLRFTLYGVTLFSFSMVYGAFLIFKHILITWGEYSKKIYKIVSYIFIFLVVLFALNNIIKYNKYSISPSFFSSTDDIRLLDNFKKRFKKDDFLIAWWDYGWELWYYLNSNNTLIDNGKHQQDTYIFSKIVLSSNQNFVRNASIFFVDKYRKGIKRGYSKVMNYFLQNYPIEYLAKLKDKDFKFPHIKGEIYILLHKNMLSTLSAIELCSNINLKTGKSYPSNFIDIGYLTKKFDKSQTKLKTDANFSIDTKKGEVRINGNFTTFSKIIIFNKNKIVFKKRYIGLKSSTLIIYNGHVLLLKPKIYNSFLIQALLFNNYNHNLFEEVARNKTFAIFRVKTNSF